MLGARLEELLISGNVAYSCFKSLKLKTMQLLRIGVGKVLMTSQHKPVKSASSDGGSGLMMREEAVS